MFVAMWLKIVGALMRKKFNFSIKLFAVFLICFSSNTQVILLHIKIVFAMIAGGFRQLCVAIEKSHDLLNAIQIEYWKII